MLSWTAAMLLAASLNVPSGPPLNVPLVKQTTNMWCWAACTEMVMRYYQGTGQYRLPVTPQCELADIVYTADCGCPRCNEAIKVDDKCILDGANPPLAERGFDCVYRTARPLAFCELAEEFHGQGHTGRPVLFEWVKGLTRHLMVALDADIVDGRGQILVNNPGPTTCGGSTRAIDYDDWVGAQVTSGSYYTHGIDYYGIYPSSGATGWCPKVDPEIGTCSEGKGLRKNFTDGERLPDFARAANELISALEPEWKERMGFSSLGERQVEVLEYLDTYQLGIDRGTPPDAPFDSVIFPPLPRQEAREYLLTDRGTPIGTLTAYRTATGWRVAGIGSNPGMLEAFALRHAKAAEVGAAGQVSLVQVPVFNFDFLLFRKANDLYLMPVRDEPSFKADSCGGMSKGRSLKVSCLYPLLRQKALSSKGLPN